MKIRSLKIDKACGENWENMSPNSDGRFCHLCSKTVIDFTQLSPKEISEKLKASKGNTCAKLTKTQLKTPIIEHEKAKQYSLPYSKVAAGVMLAASLTSIQSCDEQPKSQNTEFVSFLDTDTKGLVKSIPVKQSVKKEKNSMTFVGKIISQDAIPMHNASVMYVTLDKLVTTKTDKNGMFKIQIPNESITDNNVFRISFDEVESPKTNDSGTFEYYETDDVVVSRENMSKAFLFRAERDGMILGGIGAYGYELKNNPVILVNGVKISFKEFNKSRMGEKNSCNLDNKAYYHFVGEAAIALYGKEAKYGLYLFLDENKS